MKLAELKRRLKSLMRENGAVLRSIPHPLRQGDSMMDYAEGVLNIKGAPSFCIALEYIVSCIRNATPKIRTSTKRASYREGVSWIALNDEPGDVDPDSVSSYISTALLADLFGKTTDEVAKAIVSVRRRSK